MITILGLDPGSRNMAWSVVEMQTTTKFKIIQVGMIENTVTDLKGEVKPRANKFKNEIQSKIRSFGINLIVAERFQARGIKGNTGEFVALMLGILVIQKPQCMLITASQWKNRFNQHCDLKALYKTTKLKPHEIDSTSIALYGGAKHLGYEQPFGFTAVKSSKYIQAIESKSLTLQAYLESCKNKAKKKLMK